MTAQYNDLCELALGCNKSVEQRGRHSKAASSLCAHTGLSSCFRSGPALNDSDAALWIQGAPFAVNKTPAPEVESHDHRLNSILTLGKGVDTSTEHVDCTLALGRPSASSTDIFHNSTAVHQFMCTAIEESSRIELAAAGSAAWQSKRLVENPLDAQLQLVRHIQTLHPAHWSLKPEDQAHPHMDTSRLSFSQEIRNYHECPWQQDGLISSACQWTASNLDVRVVQIGLHQQNSGESLPPMIFDLGRQDSGAPKSLVSCGNIGGKSSTGDGHLLGRGRACAQCKTMTTPLWRNGPKGPKSLCNACGIRYKKEERRCSSTIQPPRSQGLAQFSSHVTPEVQLHLNLFRQHNR